MTHNIIIRHLVFPCTLVGADVPGGPRPRWRLRWHPRVRGAPGTSRPTIITWSASCVTLCSRVSLVGADVPGGPRSRWRLRWRPRVRGAPGTSRPTIITWLASCVTLCSRVSLVGADVPGGPRPDGVSAGFPVCASRRRRRALP